MPVTGRNRRWLGALALAAAGLAQAETKAAAQPDFTGLFASMASALSDAKPEEFLRSIDPAMPGYARLASNIAALVAQNEVTSSVVIEGQKGDAAAQEVELAWRLEVKGIGQSGVFVQREAILRCRLARWKKKWRVVSLDPAAFFNPPGVEADR